MTLPNRWHVFKGETLVLEVRDEPGPIVSTSAPPPLPGEGPVLHPFLAASAFDPDTEGHLGGILRSSSSLDDFLTALRDAGYRVEDAPWPPTSDDVDS